MRTRASALLLLALPALTACGDGETTYAIHDVRTTTDPGRPVPPENAEETRFAASAHPAVAGFEDDSGPRRSRWAFQAPQGWTELPPAPMRDHGWRVGGEGAAECTLVFMGGGAGGLLGNVNRWRKQMSLPPIEAAALAELPTRPWLGADARLVTLEGTFVGMGGTSSVPNARLIGLVAPLEGGTAFLKLTGPAGVVAAEEKRFFELAASLRRAPPSVAEEPVPEAPREDPAPREGLSWTAPEGWTRQPAKPMRLVTFSPAAAPDVVVYVTVLGGRAGGLRANLERWHREMGLPAPADAEIERLERGPVLDGRGVYVQLEGSFTGMGASAAAGYALLGMVLEREKGSVFVKMVGPAAAVKAEKARFRAFCESLRE